MKILDKLHPFIQYLQQCLYLSILHNNNNIVLMFKTTFGYAPDGNKSFVPVRWGEIASPWLPAAAKVWTSWGKP